MTDTQASLIALLQAGKLPGESGVPERVETVISNVFLFKERACKLYKNDNEFFNKTFNDLSDRAVRLAFTQADFRWNQQLASEVYLRLQGVRVRDGVLELAESGEEADELLQVTKRLPSGTILFDQLGTKALSEADFREMGKQFGERELSFVLDEERPNETALENVLGRYADIDEWMKSVEQHMPASERETYMRELKDLIGRVYGTPVVQDISVCFDSHSLNAFYVDETLYPFDTYSPKAVWRFGPPLLNVYRIAVDIFALAGEKKFRAFIDGYRESTQTGSISNDTERFMVIYASLIMVPYLYMIGESDTTKAEAAARYHAFLKDYSAKD